MIAEDMRKALSALNNGYQAHVLSETQFFACLAVLEECADRVAELEGKPVPPAQRLTDADLRSGKVVKLSKSVAGDGPAGGAA